MKVKKIVTLGLLSAISIILVYFIRFPFFASFLEYDPADIPILIATIMYGTYEGMIMTFVVSIIQGITVSSSGIIGIIMHILSTGSFILATGILYKSINNKYSLIISIIFGIIINTVSMVVWNLIFTPIFLSTSYEAVIGIIVPLIIPFNIFKSGINGVITFILYKFFSNK